ncbi:MAG TPA: hypothetical protein PLW78_11225 [bacterium]|nr:hypothetical protein [bacterium]
MTNIQSTRVKGNVLSVLLGYRLLERVATNIGEKLPITLEEAADSLIKVVLEDTLNSTSETKSAVDITLESMDIMLGRFTLKDKYLSKYHKRYAVNSKFSEDRGEETHSEHDNYALIDLRTLYDYFRKYHKDHNLSSELLSWADFSRDLTKMPYFVKKQSVRFEDGVRKGFKINLSFAKERGLEMPNLYNFFDLGDNPDEDK